MGTFWPLETREHPLAPGKALPTWHVYLDRCKLIPARQIRPGKELEFSSQCCCRTCPLPGPNAPFFPSPLTFHSVLPCPGPHFPAALLPPMQPSVVGAFLPCCLVEPAAHCFWLWLSRTLQPVMLATVSSETSETEEQDWAVQLLVLKPAFKGFLKINFTNQKSL